MSKIWASISGLVSRGSRTQDSYNQQDVPKLTKIRKLDSNEEQLYGSSVGSDCFEAAEWRSDNNSDSGNEYPDSFKASRLSPTELMKDSAIFSGASDYEDSLDSGDFSTTISTSEYDDSLSSDSSDIESDSCSDDDTSSADDESSSRKTSADNCSFVLDLENRIEPDVSGRDPDPWEPQANHPPRDQQNSLGLDEEAMKRLQAVYQASQEANNEDDDDSLSDMSEWDEEQFVQRRKSVVHTDMWKRSGEEVYKTVYISSSDEDKSQEEEQQEMENFDESAAKSAFLLSLQRRSSKSLDDLDQLLQRQQQQQEEPHQQGGKPAETSETNQIDSRLNETGDRTLPVRKAESLIDVNKLDKAAEQRFTYGRAQLREMNKTNNASKSEPDIFKVRKSPAIKGFNTLHNNYIHERYRRPLRQQIMNLKLRQSWAGDLQTLQEDETNHASEDPAAGVDNRRASGVSVTTSCTDSWISKDSLEDDVFENDKDEFKMSSALESYFLNL